MDSAAFELYVEEALDGLPEGLRERLSNVVIVVEDEPDPQTRRRAGVRHGGQLLGFYHGIPLPQRSRGYNMVTPDRISIYRLPILSVCRTRREVRETVRRVVRHEIAHHFGIGDDRLREIGAY